jgi:predicted metal-binding membrane protein
VRDLRVQSALGLILALTGLGWLTLLLAEPLGLSFICSAEGLTASIAPWDVARGASLLCMWALMSATMMLPCANAEILTSSRSGLGRALLFGGGYLTIAASAGAIGGLVHWVLESTGLVEYNWLGAAALAMAAAIALMRTALPSRAKATSGSEPYARGLSHGRSHLGSIALMICLQFAGGASNLAWMAVLALWMLAGSLMPLSTRQTGLLSLALFAAAGLSVTGAFA